MIIRSLKKIISHKFQEKTIFYSCMMAIFTFRNSKANKNKIDIIYLKDLSYEMIKLE